MQLWYTKAEAEIAASVVAGFAVLQPATAVTDVVIPHSLHPSLTYSDFIYPIHKTLGLPKYFASEHPVKEGAWKPSKDFVDSALKLAPGS